MSKALIANLKALEKDAAAQTKVLAMLGTPESQAMGTHESDGPIFRYKMKRRGLAFEIMPREYYLVIGFSADGTLGGSMRGID